MSDRNDSGQFLPGNVPPKSPGPPKGAAVRNALIRQKLEPHADDVISSIVELAKAGDSNAQRLFMSYLAPPVKPEERVDLPGFAEATTPKQKADIVAAALAAGAITVDAAERLMNFTRMYQAAITAEEHERRLAALEGRKVPAPAVEYHEVTDGDLV